MKIRYKDISIRMQSGASVAVRRVPIWEVPIIQAIHPEVTELNDACLEVERLSVSEEFARLSTAYGAEREEGGMTGVSYCEAVYGSHGIGQQALRIAMQSAVLPADTAVTPNEASPELRQDLLDAISDVPAGAADLIGEANAGSTFGIDA